MKKGLLVLICFFSFSSVIAVTDIETNEKLWNAIYFDKIVYRDFNYSTSQMSTLHYIGNQCPFVGGRVVYKARTALRMIGDNCL